MEYKEEIIFILARMWRLVLSPIIRAALAVIKNCGLLWMLLPMAVRSAIGGSDIYGFPVGTIVANVALWFGWLLVIVQILKNVSQMEKTQFLVREITNNHKYNIWNAAITRVEANAKQLYADSIELGKSCSDLVKRISDRKEGV